MLRHYLTLAVKVLLRRKVFTVINLFGIVATLTVFVLIAALFDHGLGPGAPETHRDRMLSVMRVNVFGQHMRMSASGSYGLFDRYARDLPGAEYLSIFSNRISVDSFVDGQKVSLVMKRTDADYWRVFDFAFVEGRPYGQRDVDAAEFAAVVTESARRDLLGPGEAVGRFVAVDGQRFQVVGVVTDVSEMRNLPYADIWVPLTTSKTPPPRDGLLGGFQAAVIGETPAALAGIRAEFDSRLARVERPADTDDVVAPFETAFEGLARQFFADEDASSKAPRLVALLVVAGLLLAFLPIVNLVNLNMSRILERSSEIGVRKAFGASSRALVAQFVVENVLLTLVGAVLAFLLSTVLLRAINDSGMIAHARLTMNIRVLAAGVAIALVFGVLSGVYPAWRMSRLHPVNALKGRSR